MKKYFLSLLFLFTIVLFTNCVLEDNSDYVDMCGCLEAPLSSSSESSSSSVNP